MKQLVLIACIILPIITLGQYKYGFLQETFFGRQPGARAESMGKGYCSIDGDMTTVFYNPAGTATINGLEINSSFATPYYALEKAKYYFISAGIKINRYLIAGLSVNHFTIGQEISVTGPDGNIAGYSTPTNSTYTLSISSQPVKNLFIGLNTNYFIWDPIDEAATSLLFDFGIIKRFQFMQKEASLQSVNIGASITNLNFAKIKSDFFDIHSEYELPVITRYGVNYQLFLNRHLLFDSLNTFRFLWQGEYQLLLNSEYHSGFHTGAEFMFFEILSLRVGYYIENEKNFDLPSYNKNTTNAVTYGLGLQVPLYKMTGIPLNFNFDFVSLPQVSYTKDQKNRDNFSTYTLKINWIINSIP